VRPERLGFVQADGDLAVTVERVIYLGTDLQVMVRLDTGDVLQVLMQNAARIAVPEPGTRIGIKLEEGAARLLAD
jgi:spermidine/putrescine transport system ATP-binding protein